MKTIRLPWRSGNQSGFSRYGSIPGKGDGIERLLFGKHRGSIVIVAGAS